MVGLGLEVPLEVQVKGADGLTEACMVEGVEVLHHGESQEDSD